MSKNKYILGLNTTYHELSACLLKNGELIAAVEEERFNRIKHGKSALVDNPDVLPVEAMRYCLNMAGIELKDVDFIGLSFCPKDRLKNIGVDKYFVEGDWGSKSGEELFYEKLLSVPRKLSKLAGTDVSDRTQWIHHHISHAGSAYYVAPYEESAILSIDGIGELTSTWLRVGKKNNMTVVKEIEYPNSVGFLWEKFCKFFGFSDYDAQKLMGLASYGNKEKYLSAFDKIVKIKPVGEFELNVDILRFRANDYEPLEKLFGVKKLSDPNERTPEHEDIAAALQAVTDKIILNMAKFLARTTKSKNLCMAGGVALNCVSNYEIMNSGLFGSIYVQPAAHDAGTALGAAYYIWNEQLGNPKKMVMRDAYWGPGYTDKEVETALKRAKVSYKKLRNIEKTTAKHIANGKIVGWFQGRLEWGPRALGNRSLTVDPRKGNMKEILNVRIKRRELFRPFAPSVLEADAAKWFEIPKVESLSKEFMEFTFPVKENKQKLIPAVTHVDGTSRIQIVAKKTNPKYHKLISEFKKITGVPMILNTSFNDNEPIVCSPTHAIKTFQRTKMDYLAIHDFLVSRD